MAKFMQIKFENPKMQPSEIADQLIYSNSALQRYRNDINMLSPYRIQPNATNKRSEKVSSTNLNNNPHRELELKRPQMTSNVVAKPETNTEGTVKRTSNDRNKNIFKGVSLNRDIEINVEFLDEILHNNNL